MAKINLGKMSREELVKLKSDIDAQLKAKEKSARKDALDAIKKAAAAHGFSGDEIVGDAPKKRGPKPCSTRGKAKPKAKAAPKSAPKYANPADPKQTWTGRGRQPNWVKEAVAKGKKLADMAI